MMLPKQKIVDTHTHICDTAFDPDREEVLKKADAAGVGAIIALGENLADARRKAHGHGRADLLAVRYD